MRRKFFAVLPLAATFLFAGHARAAEVSEVKSYLVNTVEKMKKASAEFVENSNAYAALVAANGGPEKAYATKKGEVQKLVSKLQDGYKAMDSFGYETVEGIVAGVERFAAYDVYLDAGLPKGKGKAEEVSPLKLKLSNGETIDREGSSFTYIIEPALWGGNKQWCVPVDLDGDGKVGPRESLPRPELLTAVAVDTDKKIGELLADARAWQPTVADCYHAMVSMTPTLSDYFEDWKESRYSKEASGRFYAVSRISDMQGIMKSCAVMYRAVESGVKPKDQALARTIDTGFKDIFAFLDDIEAREKHSSNLKPAVIDELADQAKNKTDKLVPQIKQAAALAGVKIAG
jgi:hypothetical protein